MSKLILTNEVAGLGSAGDVIEVKDGYARNYLIPQGFAVAWSRGGEKQVASIRAARETRAIHDHEEAVALQNTLQSNKVKLTVKAGAEGRLFGSVKPEHVANAVKDAGFGDLDKRKIHITSPIKSVGEHEATIRLRDDVTAVITLQVVAAK
ncbi:large subunit ribosomal protein L9 [Microbacterium endophyticum]|uniref:Large ribosomal subunit protein bL9 n=1 Tax=Microbacterium endophyticum TaxID=1526412 RepID=A0A7W4YMI7_9MICO|nr:50S ribosomal protein L9 [Microbacterium endophyticum]MBB2976510.1 large subunit ribosomal protein L9 [Microbacterium endophyticum]NIK35956.1 large subunit ribosomal protein L9 [Microbacterium endophyticum]